MSIVRLLVWAAAGVLTLIGALVTAELASAFPGTGGVYIFLRESYSPAVALSRITRQKCVVVRSNLCMARAVSSK